MKNVSHLLIGTSIACLLAVYSAHADEDSHGHSYVAVEDSHGPSDHGDEDSHCDSVHDGHNLELELHVERGVGYRPVDRHNEETSAIDLLQIDAVFMPIRRVNFTIDETAVAEGGSTRERLRMEEVTDGSTTPEAVSYTHLTLPTKRIV